jgi:SAM-dependent methyltransferase
MDLVADRNELYGTKQYWDDRYSRDALGQCFDWFKSYKDIAHLISAEIPDKSARILMLGCGNSSLSEEMWDDGYQNIVNVDYSSVVITNMQQRNAHRQPGLDWLEMDVRDLKFDDSSFDVVIDKGTMDSMMTTKGDVWNPPDQVVQDCNKEVDEVLRIMKRTGVFIYFTFGQPHFRRRYLTRDGYKLEIRQLGDAFHYYCYVLRQDAAVAEP